MTEHVSSSTSNEQLGAGDLAGYPLRNLRGISSIKMFWGVLVIGGLIAFSAAQLARMMILLSGRWKGPILRTCEHYSPTESMFDPLPSIFFWSGTLVLSISTGLSILTSIRAPIYLIGAGLMIIGFWIGQREREGRSRIADWMPVPLWYKALKDRTTREERRHIAYMWLNLPPGTRAYFNDNDSAFASWVDLIVISTVQRTVYDPVMERSSQFQHYQVKG